jgi:pyruvate/2-oxoacid:ferredoxin oxidoreductase alpha subunit
MKIQYVTFIALLFSGYVSAQEIKPVEVVPVEIDTTMIDAPPVPTPAPKPVTASKEKTENDEALIAFEKQQKALEKEKKKMEKEQSAFEKRQRKILAAEKDVERTK